jgi:putative polyhydroxyalkanoate system protein
MSKILIRQHHNKSHEEVVDILKEVEQTLITRFKLSTSWKGDNVIFKRSGLDGELCIEPGCVVIKMKLGRMLGLFARQIQTELETNLANKLA